MLLVEDNLLTVKGLRFLLEHEGFKVEVATNVSIKMSGDLNTKLKVDRKWQSEALSNILKNCIEHSRTGQSVDIIVQNTAVFAKITISDNGDGISTEDMHHIFERFYKAKNARDESIGIGLAFAKTVIEADGGQVRVKSKLGDGARFIINYYKR